MAKLQITLDGVAVGEVPVDKERITIGRRADNDIQLDHIAVSGQHAAVVTILNDSFLEDLGSTNGTLVNGAAVRRHFLHSGDVIEIGRHRVRFLGEVAATREVADFEKTMVLNRPGSAPRAPITGDVKTATVAASARPLAETTVALGEDVLAVLDAPATEISEADADALAVARSVETLRAHPTAAAPDAGGEVMEQDSAAEEPALATEATAAAMPLLPPAMASLAPAAEPAAPAAQPVAPSDRAAPAPLPASPGGPDLPAIEAPPAVLPPHFTGGPVPHQARLQVLNGTAAGRILEISKPLTTIGRPGVQVAVISRRSDGYYLAQVDGDTPARLNAAPLVPHAVALQAHDVLEIAGIKLEFFFHA